MLYELTDVTKRYTQRRKQIDALAGIDLTIDEGEFLAIQGSTGSGKTTLLQMLGAMDRPSGGKLDFEGRDLAKMGEGDLSELRSHSFGFIFQALQPHPDADRPGERGDGARALARGRRASAAAAPRRRSPASASPTGPGTSPRS